MMIPYTKYLILFLLLPLFALIFSVTAAYTTTKNNKVYEVADQLMCPVCRGQTVADSNSELARDMRNVIKQMLNEGKTEEEIITYFSERYGNSILASPPVSGINIFLWFLPLAGLIFGFVFLVMYLKRESRKRDIETAKSNTGSMTDRELMKTVEDEIRSEN